MAVCANISLDEQSYEFSVSQRGQARPKGASRPLRVGFLRPAQLLTYEGQPPGVGRLAFLRAMECPSRVLLQRGRRRRIVNGREA